MSIDLDFYLSGIHAGTIRGSADMSFNVELAYTTQWLDTVGSFPLSLSMPLRDAPYRGRKVVRFLESLLPENPHTLLDWRRRYKNVDISDPISVLSEVGEDVAGAVRFVPAGQSLTRSRARVALSDDDVGALLEDIKVNRGAMPRSTQIPKISLAGQQPKIGLYRDSKGWWFPLGDEPSTHILKPAAEELTDIDINEKAMLSAASSLGINTTESALEEIGGQRVFIATRYDRERDSTGRVQRIHQEDMVQALGFSTQAKYQKTKGPGLKMIVPFIRDHVLDPDYDLGQWNRLLAFNVAIGNADAHAKNHSILITPTGYRLAPAYDLLSVAAYPMYDQELAMSIGKQYHTRQVREQDWRQYAKQTGQEEDQILNIVSEIWQHAPDAVRDALVQAGAPVSMRDSIMTLVESATARIPTQCQSLNTVVLPTDISPGNEDIFVQEYRKSNGTVVSAHYRSRPSR